MKHDDSLDPIEYLKLICRNCKKANGYCIKDEPYISLCAINDKEELLELKYGKK